MLSWEFPRPALNLNADVTKITNNYPKHHTKKQNKTKPSQDRHLLSPTNAPEFTKNVSA